MTFNARSLRNKTIGVTEFLTEYNCDACFVTESWLKVTDTSIVEEIKDMGYALKFQPRKGKGGGGICTVYKPYLDITKCNVRSYKSFEIMEVIIKGKSDIIRVSTFYRTGKMSKQDRSIFSGEFDDYLQCLAQKKGEKILCGDFNIHVEEENNLDKSLLYFTTESYGFSQVIDQSTHKDGGTLDLVFVQKESKCFPSVNKSLFIYDLCYSLTSDHKFIEFKIPFVREDNPDKNIELSYRDFDNVDTKQFCNDVIKMIHNSTRDFFKEDVDSAAEIFNACLTKIIDNHAPLINASVKPKRTPFTNGDIIALRRQRRKAERSYRKYKTEDDESQFKSLVNGVRKLVNKTRNGFYQNKLALCKGNKKDTFKVLDKLLGNNAEHQLPAYDNKTELCNDFEHYFSNKIHLIRENTSKGLNKEQNTKAVKISNSSFNHFVTLSNDDVTEVIESLPNKQCALDPISAKFFKQCLQYLLQYVKYILNLSLEKGVFPACYKQALIKPKIKGHLLDKDLLCNYRPLSNLSFMSKALERCVMKQLFNYLESNHIFNDFQSAYRKFHSCETAITKISNDILCSLDNKKCTLLLFLDLSAAFDTVDHNILLSMLQVKYGINSTVLDWLKSYLFKRNCKVNIAKCFSDGIFLLFGVPQGSILGPILFILYIADIELIAKRHGLVIHIYADDTQLYIAFEKCNILSTISNVEYCLRDIKHWMSNNFLKINEDKTKFLIISTQNDLYDIYTDMCISFSGNIITPTLDAVNLGVIFDSKMSMNSYINSIVSKGYFKLSNFWRNADKLTHDLKLQLVTAYILPLIDYCNITFTAASKLHVNKLQKLLNSAVRFIFNLTGKKYRYSITPYMKKLHILPVESRIKYKISLTVYKCIHDLAPSYLQQLIQPRITYSHLRSANDVYALETTMPCSKYGQSAFSYVAPKEWNKLPQDIKLAPSIDCFKKRLKSFYFIDYYGND